jgi:hypothetical protein
LERRGRLLIGQERREKRVLKVESTIPIGQERRRREDRLEGRRG